MTERLRLEAEMRDNATPGIRRLRRELEAVQRTPGMESASRWMDAFSEKSRGFVRDGGGVSGTMHSIGIGGIAAAASLGELVRQFKELAEHTEDMRELGRQTGLSTDQVNQLSYAAGKLHLDPEKMTSALTAWSDKMFDFRRHVGDLYGELNQFDPSFARKLSFETPEQQLHDIFDYLGKIQDPQLQKRWTALFFGSGDLSRVFAEGPKAMNEAWDEAMTKVAKITPELEKQTAALHNSVIEFNTAWTNFETSIGPAVFKGLKETTDELKTTFDQIERVYEFFQQAKDHPVQAIGKAALDSIDAAAARNQDPEARAKAGISPDRPFIDLPRYTSDALHGIIGDKALGRGEFVPAQGEADRSARLSAMQAELDTLNAKLKADTNSAGFPVREADTIARVRELRDAINTLRVGTTGQLPTAAAKPDREGQPNPLLHRSAYITGLDGGEDDKGGLPSGTRDFVTMIGAGTKLGFLAAFHELQGGTRDTSDGGLVRASYETEGGGSGRRANLRYGRQGSGGSNAFGATIGSGDGTQTTQAEGAGFTAGMRARNLGNIGYFGQKTPGLVGPSNSRDVDHSIAMFATQEDGIRAAAALALRKYQQGMHDTASLIAGPHGWTPGALGPGASVNIAGAMGLTNRDDLHLDQPGQMQKFLHGLAMQEHGKAGAYFSDAMIDRALTGSKPGMSASGNAERAGTASAAVDRAASLMNATGEQAGQALGSKMTPGEWCADFVNGVLKSSGGKGVNSSMASAFGGWGHEVGKQALKKGDVLVENHHVGMATGEVDRQGRIGMISGNYSNKVSHSWERPDEILHARRENELQPERPNIVEEQRKADPMTVRHTGGAVIDIRGLPTSRGTSVKTSGMVSAINLQRGPTFASPSELG